MKKIIFIFFAFFLAACCKDEDVSINNNDLVTARSVFATIDEVTNYNGLLEVFPCVENSTVYEGNYFNNELMPLPAYYDVINGIGQAVNSPLTQTAGVYNLIYWGFPEYSKYSSIGTYIEEPAIRLGTDLKNLYYSLSKISSSSADTLYRPVYDIVHGTQTINISTQNLTANLSRVTAGMNVIVSNSDGTAFTSAIDSMWMYINGINYKLNFATGQPAQNVYKTVVKGMSINSNKTQYTTDSMYVFPSVPNPYFQLFVKLNTGTVKNFENYLSTQLSQGTFTTLLINLNGILISKTSTGNFTIDSWVEQTDSITFPVI